MEHYRGDKAERRHNKTDAKHEERKAAKKNSNPRFSQPTDLTNATPDQLRAYNEREAQRKASKKLYKKRKRQAHYRGLAEANVATDHSNAPT